ncbi:DUF6519 domain-containing protein [Wenjunlia tyrosinilytica]|uniref:Uncharacterized protein n=1 Tax=Wenjunlia tyrosinilytica TaxID=1544741 RepID=A0A917ZVT8_9ACTN|nr:DUF6519 domain-containing protein [Wenjunlia tyrosinilytica]GGO94867.1 hypothetical protein GCM10012280_50740 [Wenjunlia tyrosinilytica]
MHADLSRVTFRPAKHYSGVLAQQGRVQLDADANEQTAIHLHQVRTVAADLIGQHGGPSGAVGFHIHYCPGNRELDDLLIGPGRYYVDGILCDAARPPAGIPVGQGSPDNSAAAAASGDSNGAHDSEDAHDSNGSARSNGSDDSENPCDSKGATWTYWDQPDAYRDPEDPLERLPSAFPYLVYLKVFEREVTAAEDPELREVALGAALPDTAARIRTVWQVLPLDGSELDVSEGGADTVREAFRRWVERRTAPGAFAAFRTERPPRADDDPCLTHPQSRYRGPENQLYRVEVHTGGEAGQATFVWSRENGSVVFPIASLDGTWVDLSTLGSDDKLDLAAGDWVEVVDSAYTSRGVPADLLRVEEVDLPGRRVRLSAEPGPGVARLADRHPFLRRWDHRATGGRGGGTRHHRDGAVRLEEGTWLDLEDGVQVWFEPGGFYRTGDYWTAAARTATGTVEWPLDADQEPLLQPPAGIETHYAPLAWVGGENATIDLRFAFPPLAVPIEAVNRR